MLGAINLMEIELPIIVWLLIFIFICVFFRFVKNPAFCRRQKWKCPDSVAGKPKGRTVIQFSKD